MRRKPTLCIDFDGVIHGYTSGWKGVGEIPDPPVPGSIAALIRLQKDFEVAIFSSRSSSLRGRRAMKRWLRRWVYDYMVEAEFQEVEQAIGQERAYYGMEPWPVLAGDWTRTVMREFKWPWFKPAALLTIDDRALCFDGTWPTRDEILAFQPWNKRKH